MHTTVPTSFQRIFVAIAVALSPATLICLGWSRDFKVRQVFVLRVDKPDDTSQYCCALAEYLIDHGLNTSYHNQDQSRSTVEPPFHAQHCT